MSFIYGSHFSENFYRRSDDMDQKGYLNVNLKKVITISHNKVLMIVTNFYSLKELLITS